MTKHNLPLTIDKTRTCRNCAQEFQATGPNQQYCLSCKPKLKPVPHLVKEAEARAEKRAAEALDPKPKGKCLPPTEELLSFTTDLADFEAAIERRSMQTNVTRRRGRPPKLTLLDADISRMLGVLARMQCTQVEAAAVLGVHVRHLQRFMDKHSRAREIWDEGMETGRQSLRRVQYKSAMGGNVTMMIWLGKQYLGQADKLSTDAKVEVKDNNAIAELKNELQAMRERMKATIVPGQEPMANDGASIVPENRTIN